MSTLISAQSFAPKSSEDNTQSYADLMPTNKKLWASCNLSGTTIRLLLAAFSGELARFQDLEFQLANTYIPNFDNSMIERWEQDLGIPDSCFTNDGTDAERRRNIIIKLAYMNLQTQQDYFDLANLLGLDIQISYADTSDAFPYTFPIALISEKEAKFTWFINISNVQEQTFPYTFQITFGESASELFQCICQKQKGADTRLIFSFNQVGNHYIDNSGNFYIDQSHDFYVT